MKLNKSKALKKPLRKTSKESISKKKRKKKRNMLDRYDRSTQVTRKHLYECSDVLSFL